MEKYFPTHSDFRGLRKNWRADLIAGITVGIVALPLALAFGITTGTGAASGLITAIIAGFIAAIFGGSNYQVSGPTGAMTVVLVPIVSKYGSKALLPLGVIAGIIVIISGLLKCGSIMNKVPWPVMEGFTFGIALVIAIQQIPGVFAVKSISGHGTVGTAINTIRGAVHSGLHWSSISIVFLTLFIKFTYPNLIKKSNFKFHIPASFVAIFIGTIFVELSKINVPRVGDLPRNIFQIGNFDRTLSFPTLIIPAIEIALLAAIESLLSARIADGLAHQNENFVPYHPNRELFGQGLASTLSSIFGGLPATGAIARTGVNVRSGGRTRAAAAIHAIFLLAAVFILNPIISKIPTAILAGILLGTSYRIARPATIKEALSTTGINAVVLVITSLTVLFIDLIWGIALGTFVYLMLSYFSKAKNKSSR